MEGFISPGGQGKPYEVINIIHDVMALPGHKVMHSIAYTLEDGQAMTKIEWET